MNKIVFILIGIILMISACKSLHFVKTEESKEVVFRQDGKCFSECEGPDYEENAVRAFAVYTGNENEEEVELETVEVELTPTSTKWIKKRRRIAIQMIPTIVYPGV